MVAGGTLRCCRGCAVRYGWSVQEYLRRGLADRPDGTYVAMLTVTEDGRARDAEAHFEAVSRLLEALWKFLGRQMCHGADEDGCRDRYVAACGHPPVDRLGYDSRLGYGPRKGCAKCCKGKPHDPVHLPYAGVRELQERGAWHTHLILVGWPRVDLRALQTLASVYGFGRAGTHVRSERIGPRKGHSRAWDASHVAAYLAKSVSKYLGKSMDAVKGYANVMEQLPEGHRLLLHSKDWLPGESLLTVVEARKERVRQERLAAEPAEDPGPWDGTGERDTLVAWAAAKRRFYEEQAARKRAEAEAAQAAIWEAARIVEAAGLVGSVHAPEVAAAVAARAAKRPGPFGSSTDTDFSEGNALGPVREKRPPCCEYPSTTPGWLLLVDRPCECTCHALRPGVCPGRHDCWTQLEMEGWLT